MKASSLIAACLMAAPLAMAGTAQAQDKVTYGTNWLAQAEHGGFYQAVADGTYAKYGLDVTIRQGGPQAANRALLLAGKIDFYMGGMMSALDSVKEGVPTITVAAMFQKDPQILMAHPDVGIEKFEDLGKLSTLFVSKEGFVTFFQWMKSLNVGFKDEQFKSYTFNPAPFLADKQSGQQGYLTSEPYEIEKQAGFKPKIFLLADAGYDPYSTTIETMQKLVDEKPDVVQRFVDATEIGWYNYLYGDNKAANELIKKDNPEMTDGQLAYSLEKMKEYGIVVSGEAETKGIGCMTDARMKEYFDKVVAIKLFEPTLDYKKAYTTKFVCKGVGVELKK
ncbi:MAG TPA: ABC transporter substrate-binding protein [Mesorhizobium sp.]